ncbi:MAG: peptidylprolyl isomerase [Maritimibacter sp.]|nr:peptidylprolyl isomerase [Maritimibacter sp.]
MKLMAKPTVLIAGAALALWAFHPGWAQDAQAPADTEAPAAPAAETGAEAAAPVDVDMAVATVNGETITLGQAFLMFATYVSEGQVQPSPEGFDTVVSHMIEQMLFSQNATSIPKLAQIQIDNTIREIRYGAQVAELTSDVATDDKVQALYEADYAAVEPTPEWESSHILVATEEEATALSAELAAGGDFDALAKEHSLDSSAQSGGKVGWFGRGALVAPYQEAVEALEIGQISAPVESQFGWHIIRLDDKRVKGAPPLEEVKDKIVKKIQQDTVAEAYEALLAGATVEKADLSGIDLEALNDPALYQ